MNGNYPCELIEKLKFAHDLSKEEWQILIEFSEPEWLEHLFTEARAVREQQYGKKVYIRGLIEFTNYCRNNCYYCGIRCGNSNVSRYRLTDEEILECCATGYELGFRTFVLQGGEDPHFDDEHLLNLIAAIKMRHPDCALTLSIGEKEYASYAAYFKAGADRYLLRHETADENHYAYLHPESLSSRHRKQCLYDLKNIGYQVGTGFMVGSPGQTSEHLAEDMLFITELQPQMVGIGPFIPHHETPFAKENAGSVELTLKMLALLRLLLPKVLLPATTALGTRDTHGREQGILAGANVVMPNLSPKDVREKYLIYDNKISTGAESAESLELLKEQMANIGYQVVVDRGDAKDFS